jgi:NAD(P)H dehydrogenase (quinone)
MKIAVTTASGHLGSAIIKQLISDIGSDNVIGIARTPEKAKHPGVEIRKADYDNRAEFDHALIDTDAVLIVSGMDHPDNRIQQHRNIIEAAKSNGLKKIVYTSITGDINDTAFSPVVQSNRQTEEDVKNSGLNWVIGRNGLYIEPDIEYIDKYIQAGEIANCAGEGKCSYTSRNELAYAYSKMLLEDKHNGKVYNLTGEAITQKQLADLLGKAYKAKLEYRVMSTEDYINERRSELGEFLGNIIGGIYHGIKKGAFDTPSDFQKATGRLHKPAWQLINEYLKL